MAARGRKVGYRKQDARRVAIKLRWTEAEIAAVKRAAEIAQKTVSAFIRSAAIEKTGIQSICWSCRWHTDNPPCYMGIEFDEKRCLGCNPFEGDFGAPGDKCLKDRMGTARKPGPCSLCRQEIQPGARVRIAAHIFDGQLHSYRWCSLCCSAMAASWEDDGSAFEARAALGR